MKINRISHITLICKDINKSAKLFCELFGAVEVYSSDKKNFSVAKEKFFLVNDLWIALMEGEPTIRSYNHIAFHINQEDLGAFEANIKTLGLEIVPSRFREPGEGQSIYFYDYDNHLFELHTGDLTTRLKCYQDFLKLRIDGRLESEQFL